MITHADDGTNATENANERDRDRFCSLPLLFYTRPIELIGSTLKRYELITDDALDCELIQIRKSCGQLVRIERVPFKRCFEKMGFDANQLHRYQRSLIKPFISSNPLPAMWP